MLADDVQHQAPGDAAARAALLAAGLAVPAYDLDHLQPAGRVCAARAALVFQVRPL